MTVGEVFLTGSWSGWQCFGPWLEAMSSDRIMISSRHRRSLTVLPAYSSAKPDNSLTVRNFRVCHLVIHKLVFWEIIHHVHCYMPLSSSYTHFDIYFYPSHLLGDRAFLEMNRWIFDACMFLFASTLNFFFFSGCGGYLHTSRGVITSPNYPENYSPNLNCSWHVVVTTGFIIAVHFEQPFQVKSEDTSCTLGDYVEVRLLAGSPNPQSC